MTRRAPIGPAFGREWRRAAYRAGAPMEASRVVAVMVELAYEQGSTTIEASDRLLRAATELHGRGLERGRRWLVDERFLRRRDKGHRGRPSSWQLLATRLPHTTAPARSQVVTAVATAVSTAPERSMDQDQGIKRTSDENELEQLDPLSMLGELKRRLGIAGDRAREALTGVGESIA